MSDALLPSTSEWCRAVGLCRRSQSQVIVYGTLIRRSSGEVTDIHMKPARQGMTLVLGLGLVALLEIAVASRRLGVEGGIL